MHVPSAELLAGREFQQKHYRSCNCSAPLPFPASHLFHRIRSRGRPRLRPARRRSGVVLAAVHCRRCDIFATATATAATGGAFTDERTIHKETAELARCDIRRIIIVDAHLRANITSVGRGGGGDTLSTPVLINLFILEVPAPYFPVQPRFACCCAIHPFTPHTTDEPCHEEAPPYRAELRRQTIATTAAGASAIAARHHKSTRPPTQDPTARWTQLVQKQCLPS